MTDEELYLKYRDELIRYATALVGPSRAEDVLSTVVTRLYRSRRSLVDIKSLRAYLMRGVLNESLNVHKRDREVPLFEMGLDDSEFSDPSVLTEVMALPTKQRAAVYLTYWCGMTSEEAGDVMDCRAGTVRRYVHLAKRKLAEVLDD